MKHINVQQSTYIGFEVINNEKDPKFEVGDHVGRSKYKNIFAKAILQIGQREFLLLKNFLNIVLWTYVIEDLHVEKIVGTF